MSLQRRIRNVVILLIFVTVLGTVGYTLIEGWDLFDSLYMTVITVATVGYGETHPLTVGGRLFTIMLIVVGVGTAAYGFSTLTALWVEGALRNVWEKRRMEHRISGLRDHVIICGGGETGRHVAREVMKARIPVVIIEIDARCAGALRRLGDEVLCLIGDATDSEMLREVHVEHARGLVACMPSDKDNLFALLTARELNPGMRIVSRLISDDAAPRLARVGADAIVSVSRIGSLRLASEMLRPHVVSVLDAMLREPSAIRVCEVTVGAGLAGQTLAAAALQDRIGVTVFAMRLAASRERRRIERADREGVRDGESAGERCPWRIASSRTASACQHGGRFGSRPRPRGRSSAGPGSSAPLQVGPLFGAPRRGMALASPGDEPQRGECNHDSQEEGRYPEEGRQASGRNAEDGQRGQGTRACRGRVAGDPEGVRKPRSRTPWKAGTSRRESGKHRIDARQRGCCGRRAISSAASRPKVSAAGSGSRRRRGARR